MMTTEEKLNALWQKYNRLQDESQSRIMKCIDFALEVRRLQAGLKERGRQLDIAFEILEKYVPVDKMDEANDEMVSRIKERKNEQRPDSNM